VEAQPARPILYMRDSSAIFSLAGFAKMVTSTASGSPTTYHAALTLSLVNVREAMYAALE